jgi:plastocyanin
MRRAFVWTLASCFALILVGTPLAVAAGGCVNHSLADEAAASTISIRDCAFAPTVTRVSRGATVSWKNVDKLPHVISGVGWGSVSGYASTDGSMLQPGSTFSHTFTTPGVYPYACYLHPGMSGVVIVNDVDAAAAPTTVSEAPSAPAKGDSASTSAPTSDAPWSYLVIALFGIVAIGGFGIALVRRF